MKRPLRYLAIVIGVAVIGVIWLAIRWDYIRIRPVDREVEQDAVYEAVMRYVAPSERVKQVVFDRRVESENWEGDQYQQCVESVEGDFRRTADVRSKLKNSTEPGPKHTSIYDWLYVLLYPSNDSHINPETTGDFVQKYCTPGDLSQTFKTDNPKAFIDGNQFALASENLGDWPERFDRRFPGAGGITELSRVGFDPDFGQALVDWSFSCGMLCGQGNLFLMEKTRGQWNVVGVLSHRVD
jgi:hypothetical protein